MKYYLFLLFFVFSVEAYLSLSPVRIYDNIGPTNTFLNLGVDPVTHQVYWAIATNTSNIIYARKTDGTDSTRVVYSGQLAESDFFLTPGSNVITFLEENNTLLWWAWVGESGTPYFQIPITTADPANHKQTYTHGVFLNKVDTQNGFLISYKLTDGTFATLLNTSTNFIGFVLDPVRDTVFFGVGPFIYTISVTGTNYAQVVAINPTPTDYTFIGVDASGKLIYSVLFFGTTFNNTFWSVNPDGTQNKLLYQSSSFFSSSTLDNVNNLLVIIDSNNTFYFLYLVPTNGSSVTLLDSVPGTLSNTVFDSVGQSIGYVVSNSSAYFLKSVTYSGVIQTLFSTSSNNDIVDLHNSQGVLTFLLDYSFSLPNSLVAVRVDGSDPIQLLDNSSIPIRGISVDGATVVWYLEGNVYTVKAIDLILNPPVSSTTAPQSTPSSPQLTTTPSTQHNASSPKTNVGVVVVAAIVFLFWI